MGMPRASKRAQKIRTAGEFARPALAVRAPDRSAALFSWLLDTIYAARDAQLRGDFRLAAKLAAVMRTSPAMFVAFGNRCAPQRAINVVLEPAALKGKAVSIADEADALYGNNGIALTIATMVCVVGDLVTHGVSFARNTRQVRDDGSRVDIFVSHWPTEHVRWDSYRRAWLTRVEGASTANVPHEVEIVHGDGEWIVFSSHETEPWTHGALLPAADTWATNAHARRDMARSSATHGNAKVIGALPQGVPTHKPDGVTPSADAASFLELLRAVASAESPAGIKPHGSTIEYLVNSSAAWQIWKELLLITEKEAARVYLGTDGTLGATGGAPGVDIGLLLGVAATLVQGDCETIERCLQTGLFDIWTAINFGDSSLAPRRRYLIPRVEEQAEVVALSDREKLFFGALKLHKEGGFVLTQEWVDDTAARYRVVAPKLPPDAEKAPAMTLAPTDVIEWITPNEVRAGSGLGPKLLPNGEPDPDGALEIRVIRKRDEDAKAAAAAAREAALQAAPGALA